MVTDEQLSVVYEGAAEISDPELRARLADLVWVRRRSHNHARLAGESYMLSAERLISRKHILGEKERLTRAMQLASQLGRSDDLQGAFTDRLTKIVEQPETLACTVADCLRVLLAFRVGNFDRLHSIAVKNAQAASEAERRPL